MATLQATLKRCIHRMQKKLVVAILRNWWEKAHHGGRRRQIVAKCLHLLCHRAIALSFLAWRDWTITKIKNKNEKVGLHPIVTFLKYFQYKYSYLVYGAKH